MYRGDNKITYVNQQALEKHGHKKTFKELLSYYKGSITTALTFLATNKAIVFFGNLAVNGLLFLICFS